MNVVLYRLSLCCLALGFAGLSSCQLLWSPNTPKNYVLPRPKKIILDKKLNEISGLYYLSDEKAMLAIADDKQKIYRITPDGIVSESANTVLLSITPSLLESDKSTTLPTFDLLSGIPDISTTYILPNSSTVKSTGSNTTGSDATNSSLNPGAISKADKILSVPDFCDDSPS